MAGACKRTLSLPEVMSMLDLDYAQSGSDSDIDDINDESNNTYHNIYNNNYLKSNIHRMFSRLLYNTHMKYIIKKTM